MSTGPNAAQAEYWNAARHWVEDTDGHDEMLEPLGRPAIDALGLRGGIRVLDIGCGTGATTRAIAGAVEPGGQAVGADVSALLLGVARERSEATPNVSFIEADVQTHSFDAGAFDAAFSRFGVMFFSDPVAAFANVRRALAPGGRLAFVCWQTLADNDWMSVPAQAVREWMDVDISPSGAPNPFAFGDPDRLRGVLSGAGFSDVSLRDVRHPILIGGHGDLDNAVRFLAASRLGGQIRAEASDPQAAFGAVRASLEPYLTPDGVRMTAAVWLATGRA